jgi:hypothetical protein
LISDVRDDGRKFGRVAEDDLMLEGSENKTGKYSQVK